MGTSSRTQLALQKSTSGEAGELIANEDKKDNSMTGRKLQSSLKRTAGSPMKSTGSAGTSRRWKQSKAASRKIVTPRKGHKPT